MSHHKPQTKTQCAASVQVFFTAHKNTPRIFYAGGVPLFPGVEKVLPHWASITVLQAERTLEITGTQVLAP